MSPVLPSPRRRNDGVLSIVAAVLLAVLLFFMIPITQNLSDVERDIVTLRDVNAHIVIPPATPPPVVVQEEKVEVKEIVMEDMQTPRDIMIQSLQVSLNPTAGDAVAMGGPLAEIQTGVASMVDSLGEAGLSKVFEFSELRETPRILYVPTIRYPESLIRRRVMRGEVVMLIEIDQEGKAKVERVISSTHPDLESVAVDAIHRARFSVSKVDGRAVRVRGRLPLTLHAPD